VTNPDFTHLPKQYKWILFLLLGFSFLSMSTFSTLEFRNPKVLLIPFDNFV